MTLAPSNAHLLAEPQEIFALGTFGLLGLLAIGWLVLFVGALISIIGSPHTGGMKLAWLIFAFIAPFLGSLLWFVVGRGDSYRRRPVG